MGNDFVKQGIEYTRHHKFYFDAIDCFNKAIAKDPKNEQAYYQKGRVLDWIKDYQGSLECHNKVLSLNPNNVEVHFSKLESLRNLCMDQEALECCDKILSIEILTELEKRDAYQRKGLVLEKLGRHEDAIQCFDQALSISPLDKESENDKGISLMMLEKYEEAGECFDKAISQHCLRAYVNKGILLGHFGKHQEAIEYFDKANSSIFKDELAYLHKGNSLHELGNLEEAVNFYKEVLDMKWKNPLIYANLGKVLESLGREKEAAQCLKKAHSVITKKKPEGAHYITFIDYKVVFSVELFDWLNKVLPKVFDVQSIFLNISFLLTSVEEKGTKKKDFLEELNNLKSQKKSVLSQVNFERESYSKSKLSHLDKLKGELNQKLEEVRKEFNLEIDHPETRRVDSLLDSFDFK